MPLISVKIVVYNYNKKETMNSESPPTKIDSNTSSDEYINLEENDLVQQRCNNSQVVNQEYEWLNKCICMKRPLQRFLTFFIYLSATILNIMDSLLIKIVNRFYYHNIWTSMHIIKELIISRQSKNKWNGAHFTVNDLIYKFAFTRFMKRSNIHEK